MVTLFLTHKSHFFILKKSSVLSQQHTTTSQTLWFLQLLYCFQQGHDQRRKDQKAGKAKYCYILGARVRLVKEIKRDVLSRGGRYSEVYPEGVISKDP
jgi:serine phosphatase RsbU (regulator of sigma subunit)